MLGCGCADGEPEIVAVGREGPQDPAHRDGLSDLGGRWVDLGDRAVELVRDPEGAGGDPEGVRAVPYRDLRLFLPRGGLDAGDGVVEVVRRPRSSRTRRARPSVRCRRSDEGTSRSRSAGSTRTRPFGAIETHTPSGVKATPEGSPASRSTLRRLRYRVDLQELAARTRRSPRARRRRTRSRSARTRPRSPGSPRSSRRRSGSPCRRPAFVTHTDPSPLATPSGDEPTLIE